KFVSKNVLHVQRRSDGKVYRCLTSEATVSKATGTVQPTHEKGVAADGDGNTIEQFAIMAGLDWEYLHSGFGIVRITAVASPTSATALVLSRLPDAVVGGATTAQGPWTMTGDGSDVTLSVPGATSAVSAQYEVILGDEVLEPSGYTVNPTTDV